MGIRSLATMIGIDLRCGYVTFSFVEQLDALCWDLLNRLSPSEQWLLRQTLYTAPVRRQAIAALPFERGQTIADLGTGYGVMALEMAQALGVHVVGVDIDNHVITHARALVRSVYGHEDPVTFMAADAYRLPFSDQSLDGVTARFLFQHLDKPLLLSREIHRVLKPGAAVFIEDVDDGFTVEFPTLPDSWQLVIKAFQTLQSLRGGDRFIGRKISSFVHQAGLIVDSVQIHPVVQFSVQDLNDISHQFERERIEQVLPELFSHNLLTEFQWQTALEDLQATQGEWILQSISGFRVVGHRPD